MEGGIALAKYKTTKFKAKDILEGRKVDLTFYPVIYGADEGDDWTDSAGNIKADKEKSTEKIDGAIATIMALDRAIRCGNTNTESVYDSCGILCM